MRLARGVPFSAIDVLEVNEAKKLAQALKRSVRALRSLLLVCFLTILCLVFAAQLGDLAAWLKAKELLPFASKFDFVAALVVAALTYVFVRAYAVVDGDIQIADIQANILLKKRGKDRADSFQKDVVESTKGKFRQPEGYGRTVPSK